MKNLFKRTYIRHDGNFSVASDQKRLFVTSRDLQYEISAEPAVREIAGIVGSFKSLSELDTAFQGRETFWHSLFTNDQKVCIVAGQSEFAELLIQYWLSIFSGVTPQACYVLYTTQMANENLLALFQRTTIGTDYNVSAVTVEPLPAENFFAIFSRTQPSEFLSQLEAVHIPIEYLLLDYFAADSQLRQSKGNVAQTTFAKVRQIVAENVVSQLAEAKRDYLLNTHQFYRLTPNEPEPLLNTPLAFIQADPQLSWILDPNFSPENTEQVVATYGYRQLREFFNTYQKLFDFQFEEAFALDHLIVDNMPALLEYDAQDQKGNFFGNERFVFKINGLLVSFIYQLHRLGRKDLLKPYGLRTTR